VDGSGFVYVVDNGNHRIQKFTSQGQFVDQWGGYGTETGMFRSPAGIAIDSEGYVYVVDGGNYRVQKFTSNGQFVTKWGEGYSSADGLFSDPYGITVDDSGYVYVSEPWVPRIQKFTSEGQFVLKWGSEGTGDGQFHDPWDMATDGDGTIYVVDSNNHRVQKFTSEGQFIAKWGEGWGGADGQFGGASGIAIDASGYVYVTDTYFHRIQKFTTDGQFTAKWGEVGSEPGLLSHPESVALDSTGRVFVCEQGNNRVQVFSTGAAPSPDQGQATDKAIIVAGGGPFPGNNIWDATQLCTSYAYRALTYQGYSKDAIYYLSADTDLDLDGNGLFDDVDADATSSNLEYAIGTWAQDAEDLLVYMVDHGGEGNFRIGPTELLSATTLDTWLDTIQQAIPGTVTILYDACRSGSFLPSLIPPEGKDRILATSSSADEEAIFGSQGTISFSFLFWARMFNGDSFYQSFVQASNSIGVTYSQTTQLEGNSNGIGNEREDQEAAREIKIGNETRTGGDPPTIGSVSPAQTLDPDTSATIYAADVIDADGIGRVWAVITPPDYSNDSADNPVTDLPILDLNSVGNNRYEATYSSLTTEGTYNIAVYASDKGGVISLPKQTTVTVGEDDGTAAETYHVSLTGMGASVFGTVEVGDNVTVFANASNSRGGDIYYRFFYCGNYGTDDYGSTPWVTVQDYSTTNSSSYSFPNEGSYVVVIRAVENPNNEPDAVPIIGCTVTVGSEAEVINFTTLSTNLSGSAEVGAPVIFLVSATSSSGEDIYYKFLYCGNYGTSAYDTSPWVVMQDYSTSNSCTHSFTSAGNYVVVVRAVTDPNDEPTSPPIIGGVVTVE
jgi:hypothetical protein